MNPSLTIMNHPETIPTAGRSGFGYFCGDYEPFKNNFEPFCNNLNPSETIPNSLEFFLHISDAILNCINNYEPLRHIFESFRNNYVPFH